MEKITVMSCGKYRVVVNQFGTFIQKKRGAKTGLRSKQGKPEWTTIAGSVAEKR